MYTRVSFFRSAEIRREARCLPAPSYNLGRTLLNQSGEGALFVPIRSMQFMAVLDFEEIIFVDAAISRTRIEIAWQSFRPQARNGLDEPVSFEAVYYSAQAPEKLRQLQGEFHRALVQLRQRRQPDGSARILPFAPNRSPAAE
jgi:hypothetical protein